MYDPEHGFFAGGGGAAGREGDFLTSPEVGPLFADVIARALDRWWHEIGRPDPFVVVEAGAGAGTLAAGVLAAAGECAGAMRYVLVERSERLRARQATRLALESPAGVLGPSAGHDDDAPGAPGSGPGAPPSAAVDVGRLGPVATSLAELPAERVRGVVLANELLDNLPFDLLQRRGGAWLEVRVGAAGDRFTEVPVPARPELAAEADRLAPDAPDGARIPLQLAARQWLREALAVVERGRVVVIDYADTTPSLARRPWSEWVRTYVAHARGGLPLDRPGAQDVTCELAVDQLERLRATDADRSQAEFLEDHGIGDLAAAARQRWSEGAAAGSLDALKARSRLSEAAALLDPTGLGGYRVLEWVVR